MAMVVRHNLAAQLALGELNKNNNSLRKSLEKVSSGQKIVTAKDDSSAYVISEKMREQIRTLNQDNQNVQNGSALFKIADGGINSIVEELRNLKELAINAANDTNTDEDRKIMQKEFFQRYTNINDIATETNYNGKTLLDGTYARLHMPGGRGQDVPAPPYSSAMKSVSEPTGATQNIGGTNYTITSDGVYSIQAGFTGTITVNAQNVKITQADPSTALSEVQIVGPSGGNANLWIDGLNISNSNDNIIKFQGSGNVLSVKGNNTLKETSSTKAAINIGGGLNVQGSGSHSLEVTTPNGSTGAAIGSDGGESSNKGDIGIYNLTLKDAFAWYGSVIGSGGSGGSVGNVITPSTKNPKNMVK